MVLRETRGQTQEVAPKVSETPLRQNICKGDNLMETNEIEEYFTYHAPKEGQPGRYEAIRAAAKQLAYVILETTPKSADQTHAIRTLRSAVMFANASIALE